MSAPSVAAPVALIEIAVDAEPEVRAVFTTRTGGASQGSYAGLNLGSTSGDDPARVRANRRRVCDALGIDRERVTMGWQVHGALVRRVDAPSRPGRFTGGLRRWPEGDGLVTERAGLPLMVLGADCLPVLLWRRDAPAVAAVHAGWRGLLAGALDAAAAALGAPARVGAVVGPGVGPCCYPVDAALRERFAAAFGSGVVCAPAVDLQGAARAALGRAGVPRSAVTVIEACTACEAHRFYSHRRDGPASGRQAGVVWLAEAPR